MKTPTISDDHEDFLDCLSEEFRNCSISNLVYTPRNLSHSSVLLSSIWNLRFTSGSTPKPQVIITPEHESQIPTIIHCAKENDMEIRFRSAGHDFEGLSFVSKVPFVILDLIKISEVTVDAKAKTVWVGAGAILGAIYYRIAEKSPTLGFPAGFCPTVGAGGHISGGGYGPLMRKYGLAADNVIDARIVDDFATKRHDTHSPVAILSTKIRQVFAHLSPSRKDELPHRKGGLQQKEHYTWCYFFLGGVECKKVFLIWVWTIATIYIKGRSNYVQSPIPVNGIEGIWRFFYEREGQDSMVVFYPYVGRMAEISESAIPFPHRAGNLFKLTNMAFWQAEEAKNTEGYLSWTRKIYIYLTPYVVNSPRATYFNYRDLDIGVKNNNGKTSYAEASIWGLKYFKSNFDRLVRVKTIVDPKNFIRNEQSIPPLHSRWTNEED
ncbi:hypothetical protein ACS0TY_018789 [Phlomoides rotata]